MDFLFNNMDSIIQVVTSVVTVASIIARFTPTETDNVIVEKIAQFVNVLAINKPKGK